MKKWQRYGREQLIQKSKHSGSFLIIFGGGSHFVNLRAIFLVEYINHICCILVTLVRIFFILHEMNLLVCFANLLVYTV